jgi:hypothetical protein
MRMAPISWREAIKRFRVLRCRGCNEEDNGSDWFVEKDSSPLNGPYCPSCAVRLKGATDIARSTNQFYADTRGEVIL